MAFDLTNQNFASRQWIDCTVIVAFRALSHEGKCMLLQSCIYCIRKKDSLPSRGNEPAAGLVVL